MNCIERRMNTELDAVRTRPQPTVERSVGLIGAVDDSKSKLLAIADDTPMEQLLACRGRFVATTADMERAIVCEFAERVTQMLHDPQAMA